jgi:hypothetical protein
MADSAPGVTPGFPSWRGSRRITGNRRCGTRLLGAGPRRPVRILADSASDPPSVRMTPRLEGPGDLPGGGRRPFRQLTSAASDAVQVARSLTSLASAAPAPGADQRAAPTAAGTGKHARPDSRDPSAITHIVDHSRVLLIAETGGLFPGMARLRASRDPRGAPTLQGESMDTSPPTAEDPGLPLSRPFSSEIVDYRRLYLG